MAYKVKYLKTVLAGDVAKFRAMKVIDKYYGTRFDTKQI